MEDNKESKEIEKENRSDQIFIKVVVVILSLIVVGLIGYICYDKVVINNRTTEKENKEEKEEVQKEEEKDTEEDTNKEEIEENNNTSDNTNNSTTTAKCSGKYYGEASGSLNNGLTYDYKYTYNLNSDGTFTADFGGVSGAEGMFVINDNTITFIRKKGTTGPRDQDPVYYSEDYVISDDCSTIRITSSDVTFNLNKQ